MKTHDVFMSHSAFPCALSLGCWSGRTEIILASTVLLTSAAVDAVVHFHSRWWSWVWNPEGCCHAVTLLSESSSTFSYTDSRVLCCSFHFPLHNWYLRTTKVLNLCFLFDFERSWNIEAFSRSMLCVMIFTTAPRVGCKLRASAQRNRRQVIAVLRKAFRQGWKITGDLNARGATGELSKWDKDGWNHTWLQGKQFWRCHDNLFEAGISCGTYFGPTTSSYVLNTFSNWF